MHYDRKSRCGGAALTHPESRVHHWLPSSSESGQNGGKVLNRKELREENDAAERDEKTKKKSVKTEGAEEDGKKKPVKRKSSAKTAKEVRLKAFWGVFNQSMKRVALFEHSQRKQAEKKAAELTTSAKTPHFIQPVKEVIEG